MWLISCATIAAPDLQAKILAARWAKNHLKDFRANTHSREWKIVLCGVYNKMLEYLPCQPEDFGKVSMQVA
jgi:hypothetical protein